MDYLRIDENKLKITLTEEELLLYGMDLSTLSYSSTETRRAFWAILDDAKHATGFDAAASRVAVQIYASRAGGCEMYVIGTSDSAPASDCSLSHSVASEFDSALIKADPNRIPSELTACPSVARRFKRATGEFGKLSDLLSVCLALSSCGYDGDSSAWQMGDRYYLHLAGSRGASGGGSEFSASGVIAEFGSAIKDLPLSYLTEHGKCICKTRAVTQLALMAT